MLSKNLGKQEQGYKPCLYVRFKRGVGGFTQATSAGTFFPGIGECCSKRNVGSGAAGGRGISEGGTGVLPRMTCTGRLLPKGYPFQAVQKKTRKLSGLSTYSYLKGIKVMLHETIRNDDF